MTAQTTRLHVSAYHVVQVPGYLFMQYLRKQYYYYYYYLQEMTHAECEFFSSLIDSKITAFILN